MERPQPSDEWEYFLVAILSFVAGLVVTSMFAPEACAAGEQYRRELTRAAHLQWGLDAPVAMFAGQIHQESGWNPEAVSRVGAAGMAQFMPATTRWWCSATGTAAADCQPSNPTWAMRALVGYDKWLWDRVAASSACDRAAMTLSAYNGGLGWVQRDQQLAARSGLDRARWWGHVETVNAGRPDWAITENRQYPRVILLRHAPRYSAAGWGRSACPEGVS